MTKEAQISPQQEPRQPRGTTKGQKRRRDTAFASDLGVTEQKVRIKRSRGPQWCLHSPRGAEQKAREEERPSQGAYEGTVIWRIFSSYGLPPVPPVPGIAGDRLARSPTQAFNVNHHQFSEHTGPRGTSRARTLGGTALGWSCWRRGTPLNLTAPASLSDIDWYAYLFISLVPVKRWLLRVMSRSGNRLAKSFVSCTHLDFHRPQAQCTECHHHPIILRKKNPRMVIQETISDRCRCKPYLHPNLRSDVTSSIARHSVAKEAVFDVPFQLSMRVHYCNRPFSAPGDVILHSDLGSGNTSAKNMSVSSLRCPGYVEVRGSASARCYHRTNNERGPL